MAAPRAERYQQLVIDLTGGDVGAPVVDGFPKG
jgi:hypothetical protein